MTDIALESSEDILTFSLTDARAFPGVEILAPEGDSIHGTSLTIKKLTGSIKLRWGANKTELKALDAAAYGTVEFVAATKKIIRTVGDWDEPGAKLYSRPGTIIITTSVNNPGPFTVVGLGTNSKELVVVEVLVNEGPIATPSIDGYYARRSDDYDALTYPNMVSNQRGFSKLFLENTAQVGAVLVFYVGKD